MESEQSLLGDLMGRPQAFFAASAVVTEDDFYTQDHRVIWRTIAKLSKLGRGYDWVSISESLRDSGDLDDVGGVAYLATLQADASGRAENHASRVRELSQRRSLIAFGQDLASAAYSGQSAEELAGTVSTSVEALLSTSAAKSVRLGEMAEAALEDFNNARKKREAGIVVGMQTGLRLFDQFTGGFNGPLLIFLAARPKCGKTALLNQAAIHSAKAGVPGFIASIEMGANQTAARALSLFAGVNVSRLQQAADAEFGKAAGALGALSELPLWFDFETFWLDNIVAQIALHKIRFGIQWAAVDHIGLIKTRESFKNRNDQLGHITWTLKQAAKRLGIPIIALSQLGRDCDRDGRRPRADDLRDSGNLEQDADMVAMLHVALAERTKFIRTVEIGITANRSGPSLWMPEKYEFHGALQRFSPQQTQPAPTGDYGSGSDAVPYRDADDPAFD